MKFTCCLLIPFFIISCAGRDAIESPPHNSDSSWALLDFIKVDSLNPILVPDSTQSFQCPIVKKTVHWEERNVLNPSAVVRDGKVYLLYRAQDHNMTSRLGLAVSDDGLHFTKRPEPVLFPGEDSMKIYEWKGGKTLPGIFQRPPYVDKTWFGFG